MTTIDISPVLGQPWRTVRQYLTQGLGLSDRLDSASDAYALGYLSRATRMDLGKICKKGDPCGASCIPSTKTCSPEKKKLTTKASLELSAKAKGADPRFAKASGEASDRPASESGSISDLSAARRRKIEQPARESGKLADIQLKRLIKETDEGIDEASAIAQKAKDDLEAAKRKMNRLAAESDLKYPIIPDTPSNSTAPDSSKIKDLATARANRRVKQIDLGGRELLEAMKATDEKLAELQKIANKIHEKHNKLKSRPQGKKKNDRSDSFQRGYYLRMAERGDTNPFPTQKVVEYGDRRILIQTPKGQHRFFGAVPQQADYGVIAGTYGMGGDGRSLDCYVGDNLDGGKCYEVQQLKRSGEPDEVKLMLGFNSPEEASEVYKAHVPETRLGSIREIDFDSYMRGDTTAAQQKKVGQVMHEFKAGKLKSGSGAKVKSRKQAVAIALSEAGASKR